MELASLADGLASEGWITGFAAAGDAGRADGDEAPDGWAAELKERAAEIWVTGRCEVDGCEPDANQVVLNTAKPMTAASARAPRASTRRRRRRSGTAAGKGIRRLSAAVGGRPAEAAGA